MSDESDGRGAPHGNTNAKKHGLYCQRSNYYQSLDEGGQEFIQLTVESWLDNAPFDEDNWAKLNRLYKIAIDEHKMMRANDYFAEEDLIVEKEDFNEAGEKVVIREEHPVNLTYDRMSRTSIRELKELGALDDPDSQQADATESLAQQLSGLTDE